MEYFSVNTFYLGILLFACIFLSNVFYSLICLIYKIKIVEFGLFNTAWFALHTEQILGTKYILGWLPLGSYIKPLGMAADDDDKAKIHQDDLPFAFFNKPKYLQTIFRLVPWLTYIIATFVAFVLLTNTSFILDSESLVKYTIKAFKTMFTGSLTAKQNFILATKQITDGKDIVIFAFAMLSLIMLLLTPITVIFNWFVSEEKKGVLKKIFGVVATIFIAWLIFWKIPIFVFSFFSITQNIIYVLSFIVGMFTSGLIGFFATLYVVKGIAKNISERKLQ